MGCVEDCPGLTVVIVVVFVVAGACFVNLTEVVCDLFRLAKVKVAVFVLVHLTVGGGGGVFLFV